MRGTRSQIINRQQRLTVFLAAKPERLNQQQLPTRQAGMLDCRNPLTDDTSKLHESAFLRKYILTEQN